MHVLCMNIFNQRLRWPEWAVTSSTVKKKGLLYLFNGVFFASDLCYFSNNLNVVLQLHFQALCKC